MEKRPAYFILVIAILFLALGGYHIYKNDLDVAALLVALGVAGGMLFLTDMVRLKFKFLNTRLRDLEHTKAEKEPGEKG